MAHGWIRSCSAATQAAQALLLIACALAPACAAGFDLTEQDAALEALQAPPRVRVARNPYADVDFQRALRLKTALHEHVRDRPEYILRMDAAGYDAVPIMHYSGIASDERFWHERRWPPERVLPPDLFEQLRNIKLFFPSAEEVGFDHMTSPFLTTYIAKWEEGYYEQREPWHYGSTQEAIDLIVEHGGLAFIAHPWEQPNEYTKLRGFRGMELYNAYCRAKFQLGEFSNDCNEDLMRSWDRVLRSRPSVVGIAVNDWFGPFRDRPPEIADSDVWDSGKTIVLADAPTLPAFRDALERGAVLAVKDLGVIDDAYPELREIRVGEREIHIELAEERDGVVRWIADGKVVATNAPALALSRLARGTRYVRAEIENAEGSTVYTQAFVLEPR